MLIILGAEGETGWISNIQLSSSNHTGDYHDEITG